MKQIQKGFTLVEMVMAIMLMSMIALIIGVIFNTMFSSRELIEREASIQAEMRTSMQYVDRTVGSSVYWNIKIQKNCTKYCPTISIETA